MKVYCQAKTILSLPDLDPGETITQSLIFEFGVVVNGKPVPRRAESSTSPPVITENERIYLKIINDGDDRLTGSIQYLTNSKPSGKDLGPGATSILGTPDYSADGKVRGINLDGLMGSREAGIGKRQLSWLRVVGLLIYLTGRPARIGKLS